MLINIPVLVVVLTYIFITYKRNQKQRKQTLKAQALIWLILMPLAFIYGFTHIGEVKSWYRIGTDTAYFIYLSVAPIFCASILTVLSDFAEYNQRPK
ncbi:unnamed protein product [Hymenolepis diminuta]|nr:unnamed protein product [Hymenolepis diminuta]